MNAKSESKPAAGALPAYLDAFFKSSGPWAPMPPQFAQAWQQQWNIGMRMMDAWLGQAAKARDAQLPAASEFMARAAELQKLLLEARSPLELWSVQCNWMIENSTRAMALWKEMFEAATVADSSLAAGPGRDASKAAGPSAVNAPAGSLAPQDLVKTALTSIDTAYGQMLKSSQQMMAAATNAMSAGLRPVEPAASKHGAKRGPH